MAIIKFKATRRLHESGFRMLDKSGDLEYDLMNTDKDGIWITVTEPQSIKIDCERDGRYRLLFEEDKAYLHNQAALLSDRRDEK